MKDGEIVNYDRYEKGLDAVQFFMKLYNADCDRIAVENPVPSRVRKLPEYTQIIEPYQFGHHVTKKTCLWLKGLPKLVPTNDVGRPEPMYYINKKGQKRSHCWTRLVNGGKDRAKNRAKTFQGIADAMASQWSDYIKQEEMKGA